MLLFGVDLKSDFNRLKPYFDVINYDETIIEKSEPYDEKINPPQTAQNAIVLKSLSFSYPKCEEKTLKDINLEIKKGKKQAHSSFIYCTDNMIGFLIFVPIASLGFSIYRQQSFYLISFLAI